MCRCSRPLIWSPAPWWSPSQHGRVLCALWSRCVTFGPRQAAPLSSCRLGLQLLERCVGLLSLLAGGRYLLACNSRYRPVSVPHHAHSLTSSTCGTCVSGHAVQAGQLQSACVLPCRQSVELAVRAGANLCAGSGHPARSRAEGCRRWHSGHGQRGGWHLPGDPRTATLGRCVLSIASALSLCMPAVLCSAARLWAA